MWKYITRGLRAPFERGHWTNVTSASATDQNVAATSKEKTTQLPCPFRFVPCFIESCQRHLSQQFNTVANSGEERQKKDGDRKSSNRTSGSESFHSENINVQPCAILGAFGWSGVLVLGWTILQPWYRHEKRRRPFPETEVDVSSKSVKRYSCLYKLLLYPAFSQPISRSILPPHITSTAPTPIVNNDEPLEASLLASSSSSTPISSPTSSELDSKTIEEAFDEAAEEVRKVHELALGEAENRSGVACLSHDRNTEAVAHFKKALALNHAAGAFNLGQCHELGIGTKQDFTQAAHYYQIASKMGHPTAMYNLGVFYAHGWGGLTVDVRKAKNLFLTAATLGQRDAQLALSLEEKKKLSVNSYKQPISQDSFESLSLKFLKENNINLQFVNRESNQNYGLKRFGHVTPEYVRPESSLPTSPVPSGSSFSSSPSSKDSSFFQTDISRIEESSNDFSDTSSEDQWQMAIDFANANGNSATLYRLAVCYERNAAADPELMLHLYRMAADHGHDKAKQRLKVLEEHYLMGTLDEYLRSDKQK